MYGSEVVSPQRRCFQTGGLVYDNTTTKVLLFMANYGRELRMGGHKKERKGRKCSSICRKDEESA